MSESNCAICIENINRGKFTLECKHSFHEMCVKRWLMNHSTCPICRQNVLPLPLSRGQCTQNVSSSSRGGHVYLISIVNGKSHITIYNIQ